MILSSNAQLQPKPYDWISALEWAVCVRKHGQLWDPVLDTEHKELCMPVESSGVGEEWQPFVQWLAEKRNDMCLVYKVSVKQREKAWKIGARTYHDLWDRFSNTFTVQFIMDVYLALVEQHIVKVDMLQSLENLPVFRELMASTLLDVHRFYMAWSKHSDTDFKEFVQRMISVWQQPVHHVMPANYTFYSQSHMHIVEGHGEYKSMQKWKLSRCTDSLVALSPPLQPQ